MEPVLLPTAVATDEEVISKILGGDHLFFELLIRRYNPVLYRIARGYGYNHQDAEDLMQETHVTAYQNLNAFEGRSAYKTWLCRILIHKCSYKRRYGHRRFEILNETPMESAIPLNSSRDDTERTVLNAELGRALEQAIQQIPLNYRSVFVLREIDGCTVAETAQLLDITAVNVKVRLNRAKALLKRQLQAYYAPETLYAYNLIHCTAMVQRVFHRIHVPE